MLSHKELYLFDTCGLLLIRGAVGRDDVRRMRTALDEFAPVGQPFPSTTRYERLVTHDAFQRFATGAELLDRVRDVINQPFRLIESYALKRGAGSVLYMHNGQSEVLQYDDGHRASRAMGIHHTFHDGRLYCMYVKVLCYLTAIEVPADGPFCYCQGSHKANFPLLSPDDRGRHTPLVDTDFPSLTPVFVEEGDVLILNEALMHGTLRKTSERDRIVTAFSYAPAFVSDYSELDESDGDISRSGHYEAMVEESLLRASGTH